MKKSTLLVIILYVILSLCAVKINAQDSPKAVILQPKPGKQAELKLNSQGFKIPANCPDSTRVYQIGEKGSKFIFRTSKKTGKTYRFYLENKK